MQISKLFTKNLSNPYENIQFESRKSELKDETGKSASKSIDITVPSTWSQLATDILAQKYVRRAGVPEPFSSNGMENDARQVFERLAKCWTDWGTKYNYFNSEEDSKNFHDEICYMLANQYASPNSPQWFNTGLYNSYGITGPSQGHYYVDPDSLELKASTSAYERPQPFVCFIQSIDDDLLNKGGIMDLWMKEARIFKYGSGSGANFSNVRGKGEPLSGGGVSSGLMSFLKIGDTVAGSIKSGGTTRRAALLRCLNIDHPDIEEFINWKVLEEQKVASLIAGSKMCNAAIQQIFNSIEKYSGEAIMDGHIKSMFIHNDPSNNSDLRNAIIQAKKLSIPTNYIDRVLKLTSQGIFKLDFPIFNEDWTSEAYSSVSGQNANNSVRVTNEYMETVLKDGMWQLINRTDKKVSKELKSKDLWNQICSAAWHSADPGIQYDTTTNEWNTCLNDGRINASNPCNEFLWLDNSNCNLASINLTKFYNIDKSEFQSIEFIHAVKLWTIVLEISTLMGQSPSKEIALNSYKYRTLGLGYANLGSLLMMMGLPYDSDEGRNIAAAITAIMSGEAYATSAEMAKELGAFERFENNKTQMLNVIHNHHAALYHSNDEYAKKAKYHGLSIYPQEINFRYVSNNLLEQSKYSFYKAYELGEQFGYRNAQTTLLAPTGTIGLLMDCDTTGIEPDFSIVKFKKLAGGGNVKIINQTVPIALKKLGYTDKEIDEIVKYCCGHGNINNAPEINAFTLKQKGFTDLIIDKINGMLKSAFNIEYIFNVSNVGSNFVEGKLHIDKKKYEAVGFSLLRELGFNNEQIEECNNYVCGFGTLEGSPGLKDEHLPIFDCANKCGAYGKRFIDYSGHVKMMAACQPFLSGAISKTINMPADATIEDVSKVYMDGWLLGLKAVALYRDGSKLSQPLSGNNKLNEIVEDVEVKNNFMFVDTSENRKMVKDTMNNATYATATHYVYIDPNDPQNKEYFELHKKYHKVSYSINQDPNITLTTVYTGEEDYISVKKTEFESMQKRLKELEAKLVTDNPEFPPVKEERKSVRRHLPSKRYGYIQKSSVGGHKIFLRTGEYEDNTLAEIFIDMHKEGAAFKSLMNSFAIAVSLGLQFGVPLEKFVQTFAFTKFEPNGIVKGHDNIRMASSIIDYIFRDLAINYLGREDLAHVLTEKVKPLNGSIKKEEILKEEKEEIKKMNQSSLDIMGKMAEENIKSLLNIKSPDRQKMDNVVLTQHVQTDPIYNMSSTTENQMKAMQKGYTGDSCPECHQFTLVRNGTCLKCLNCGSTTGCS